MTEMPELTGPVAGEPGIILTAFDLGRAGYLVEEFFLSGTATRFVSGRPAGPDGAWRVSPADRAAFTTRVVVVRPAEPGAFTGTVVLEWLNVSAGFDAAPYWMLTHRQVLRAGWAWVGVTAQRAGVDGGSILGGAGDRAIGPLPALKASDPARYGGLVHPGDAFSFDMFSQAARAVRAGGLLGPLRAACLLAAGQSQSAIHLVSYLNAVAPTLPPPAGCDGYLIDGRTGRAAPLDGWDGVLRAEGPDGVRIRADAPAPVLTVQTETDVVGLLAGVTARQPDSDRFRWWEIAGAAHADTYVMRAAFSDSGELPAAELAQLMAPAADLFGMHWPAPVNSGPQHHYVSQAALACLDRWARWPAAAPRPLAGNRPRRSQAAADRRLRHRPRRYPDRVGGRPGRRPVRAQPHGRSGPGGSPRHHPGVRPRRTGSPLPGRPGRLRGRVPRRHGASGAGRLPPGRGPGGDGGGRRRRLPAPASAVTSVNAVNVVSYETKNHRADQSHRADGGAAGRMRPDGHAFGLRGQQSAGISTGQRARTPGCAKLSTAGEVGLQPESRPGHDGCHAT